MTDPEIGSYRDLAAMLRAQINDGTLPPGARVPSEAQLMRAHSIGRETVRRAVRELRHEGLVEVERGYGYRVRQLVEKTTVRIQRGSELEWRPATAAERERFGLGDGVAVLEVRYGSKVTVWPGDRYQATTA